MRTSVNKSIAPESCHAWRKWSSRVFIDPFAGPGRIQVAGESVTRDGGAVVAYRALAEKDAPFTRMLKKIDLAINFSTMDLQRNADLEFDPARARFDETAPGWRNDSDLLSASKQNLELAFFNYWCRLVQGLGFAYSKEMPLVTNNRGHGIYRIVFFARHDLPTRIWGDIARGPNRELFSD